VFNGAEIVRPVYGFVPSSMIDIRRSTILGVLGRRDGQRDRTGPACRVALVVKGLI
jgi:hypothetical protein